MWINDGEPSVWILIRNSKLNGHLEQKQNTVKSISAEYARLNNQVLVPTIIMIPMIISFFVEFENIEGKRICEKKNVIKRMMNASRDIYIIILIISLWLEYKNDFNYLSVYDI